LVTEELRRAGKTTEEQDIYRSIIDKAQTSYELGNAISIAGTRDDLPAYIELLDKWSATMLKEGKQARGPWYAGGNGANSTAQLIGKRGAAKKMPDCLQLLDHYLDYQQAAANLQRQKATTRPTTGSRNTRNNLSYITYWYGANAQSTRMSYPTS